MSTRRNVFFVGGRATGVTVTTAPRQTWNERTYRRRLEAKVNRVARALGVDESHETPVAQERVMPMPVHPAMTRDDPPVVNHVAIGNGEQIMAMPKPAWATRKP